MNRAQFKKAIDLAMSKAELSLVDFDVFFGFGLDDFKPVYCTIEQVARLIRWQALYLDGGIDQEALDEIAAAGRSKFIICGDVGASSPSVTAGIA